GAAPERRPHAAEPVADAPERLLGPVQRRLDVAVHDGEERDEEGEEEEREGSDGAHDALQPPRHAEADGAAPELEAEVGARREPAEEARDEEGADGRQPRQQGEEDRRLPAEQHPPPPEQRRYDEEDGVAEEPRYEGAADDGADGPEEVVRPVLAA